MLLDNVKVDDSYKVSEEETTEEDSAFDNSLLEGFHTEDLGLDDFVNDED